MKGPTGPAGPSSLSPLGLYVHVPFCQAICSYCNFNRGLFDAALKARYVPALTREIREAGDGRDADTIFFGGGTPSLLDPADVQRVLDACREGYRVAVGAEITLEVNPENASADRLSAFRRAGINRLSFGAQSFDDGQLSRLGRVHDTARIGAAVTAARQAGFGNVSLDLMFWLPGQSRESWAASVERAIELEPDHLSLYLLELYPNAPLKEAMARVQVADEPADDDDRRAWCQASDDEAADMYLDALDRLARAGFGQYEISNVSRPSRESRHNLKYWNSGAWRGFGCGAHSTIGSRRWQNVSGTGDYVDRVERGVPVGGQALVLDAQSRMEEALFTGLRLTAGIDRAAFFARHGCDPWVVHAGKLGEAEEAGWVWQRDGRFGLTRAGMFVANEILANLI